MRKSSLKVRKYLPKQIQAIIKTSIILGSIQVVQLEVLKWSSIMLKWSSIMLKWSSIMLKWSSKIGIVLSGSIPTPPVRLYKIL